MRTETHSNSVQFNSLPALQTAVRTVWMCGGGHASSAQRANTSHHITARMNEQLAASATQPATGISPCPVFVWLHAGQAIASDSASARAWRH